MEAPIALISSQAGVNDIITVASNTLKQRLVFYKNHRNS